MSTKVRYAVVGIGHFAQVAVLPAFAQAGNSELVALVSGDAEKRVELGQRYDVEHSIGYDDLDTFLGRGVVDAVYVAVPNNLHKEFTLRAARANVHVLCEKPMAMDSEECAEMVEACRTADVKLMIGYRLHFEPGTLGVVDLVRAGKIGEARLFSAVFGMKVRHDNIRTEGELGGGPLYDIGTYCINAARSVFGEEPIEVTALASPGSDDPRFREVEEQLVACLRFPSGRLATFAVGFDTDHVSRYDVIGTRGTVRVEPAFGYDTEIAYELRVAGRAETRRHERRDQIAAELVYFSDCILEDRQPEPSGIEGLCDVRVIDALTRSVHEARAVKLEPFERDRGPVKEQAFRLPPHSKPRTVNAKSPHYDK